MLHKQVRPNANCLRLFLHCVLQAAYRAAHTARNDSETNTLMMAITTNSSTSVKANRSEALFAKVSKAPAIPLGSPLHHRSFFPLESKPVPLESKSTRPPALVRLEVVSQKTIQTSDERVDVVLNIQGHQAEPNQSKLAQVLK